MHISGWRLANFEIRVGLDGTDLGNNAICYKQLESMVQGATVKFKCQEELYGSWVSVNKSSSDSGELNLQLLEVRVYYEDREYAVYWLA